MHAQSDLKSGENYPLARTKTHKQLTWAPKFSDRPNPDESDKDEAALKKSYMDNPAFIREDGAVIFRDAAFLDDSGRPSPGNLASLLYHEYWHVVDSLTPESSNHDMRNEPQTEVVHRLEQLTDEDIYELPTYDWMQNLKNIVWQNDLSEMWAAQMAAGKDPYNPSDRRLIFDSLTVQPDRAHEIDAQVEHDLSLMTNADPGDISSLESLRAAADSSFIKNTSNDDLQGLLSGWKKARDIETQRQAEQEAEERRRSEEAAAAKARVIAEAIQKVGSCGFEPQYDSDGNFYGFGREIRGWPVTYRITHPMSMDEFKVSLWLASMCFEMTMRPGEILPPEESDTLVEGVVIASEHWNDPGFKVDAQFEVLPEEQARCVNYLNDHLKQSMDAKAYQRLYVQARNEYQKGVDSSWRQTQRERQEEEDADRERRRRDENQGGSGGGRRSGSGGSSNQGHPRAPVNCGFDKNGAYCR